MRRARRILWALAVSVTLGAAPVQQDALIEGLSLGQRRPDGGPLLLPQDVQHQLVTSQPVIDDVLLHPLSFPPSAWQTLTELDAASDASEFRQALGRWSPSERTKGPMSPTDRRPGPLPSPTEILQSAEGRLRASHLPAPLLDSLLRMATALERADAAARTAWPDGPARLGRHPEEFFLDRETSRARWLAHPTAVQAEFARQSLRLDAGAMEAAAWELLAVAQAELPLWTKWKRRLPNSSGPLLVLETNLGPVVVGSTGPDEWRDDAALVVDPAGDDRWLNNAGANRGISGRAALALDVGGNDKYEASGAHSQGAGVGGIGVLIDGGRGQDNYRATRVAQGAGFFGAGLLVDEGGDDVFAAEAMAQGAAAFGLGVLLDLEGDDQWSLQARGQGFGATMGLGAALDLAGNDQRSIGVPGENPQGPQGGFGQGAGMGTRPVPWQGQWIVGGGVGLLYDRVGNDRYDARSHAQGLGTLQGLGLLLDGRGDDHYSVDIAGQGAGLHGGAGICLDARGRDVWNAGEDAQGAGIDRALGVAWDRGSGADTWSLRERSGRGRGRGGQGHARHPGALGLLVDEGGADRYEAVGMAQGDGLTAARPGDDPLGLFLDLGGKDQHRLVLRPGGVNPVDAAVWMGGRGVGIDRKRGTVTWPDLRPRPEGGSRFLESGAWPEEGPIVSPPDRVLWSRLDDAWLAGIRKAGPTAPSDLDLQLLAREHPSLQVRRAAARLLVALGDASGLDRLVESLASLSEDAPGRSGPGTLVSWLSLVTGLDATPNPDAWILAWDSRRVGFDLAARWPAVVALERASLALRESRPMDVLAESRRARDLLPGDHFIEARAVGLTLSEAEALSHEESQRWDSAAALILGEQLCRWAPDEPRAFLVVARAWLQQGQDALAARALEGVAHLDPDHPVMQSLRGRLPPELRREQLPPAAVPVVPRSEPSTPQEP